MIARRNQDRRRSIGYPGSGRLFDRDAMERRRRIHDPATPFDPVAAGM
ncbi:MAG: hypothetical protein R3F05_09520 [Planctomycetota bacterium]